MQVINSDYYSGSFHIFTSIMEEVAKKFGEKLLEYSSKGMCRKFIGSDISFQNKQFAEALYFQDATFYGKAYFVGSRINSVTPRPVAFFIQTCL